MKLLRILSVVTCALVISISAHAQATRTWVSGVGDDVNPCSRTAPCKTFAGAISKTAAGGEISVLDPGGFGAVTITKGMTLNGEGTLASILASGTNGINITAATTDHIYLRNIMINGGQTGNFGVAINGAGEVTIDHCTIWDFNGSTASRAVRIANAAGTNVQVNIINTTVRHIGGMAIESIPTGTGTVDLVMKNVLVSAAGQSAIDLHTNTKAELDDCLIANNAIAGLFIEQASVIAALYRTVITRNLEGIDIGLFGNGTVRLYNSSIQDNTSSIVVTGSPTVATAQNNTIQPATGATLTPIGQQ